MALLLALLLAAFRPAAADGNTPASESCAAGGMIVAVDRVALGDDPVEAQRIFDEYFTTRTPVILTDLIAKKTMQKWGLRVRHPAPGLLNLRALCFRRTGGSHGAGRAAQALKKHMGNEQTVVTVQPGKWVDDRESNFHAVHQYLQ